MASPDPTPPTGSPTDPTLADPRGARPGPSPLPPEAADAPPSARFGKFIRTRKLGAGGMGEVWKAWDTRLERWVALKFLKGGTEEELDRFKREAQLAGKLSHPNIAAIYEVGEDPAHPFIAMQYVDGQTLRTVPRADRREMARIVRDAARAVAYAHEQGVVHRDLKPDNVMVTPKGQVYVMDFGLARSVEGGASVSGSVVGTPAYMPPEQARGEKADTRSDVYSLGATLYQLLTDRAPFNGESVYEILVQVQEREPKAPRRIDPSIDADLETIVLKCLEKEPGRRYGTAADIADDIERWLNGAPILARPPRLAYLAGKFVRRHKALSALLTVLLVAVGWAAFSLCRSPALPRSGEGARRESGARLRPGGDGDVPLGGGRARGGGDDGGGGPPPAGGRGRSRGGASRGAAPAGFAGRAPRGDRPAAGALRAAVTCAGLDLDGLSRLGQRGREVRRACETIPRVARHRPATHGLQSRRHVGTDGAQGRHGAPQHLDEDLADGGAAERRGAREEMMEGRSKRIDIRAVVHMLPRGERWMPWNYRETLAAARSP